MIVGSANAHLAAVYASRALVVFVVLAVAYRLAGKRSLGQFNVYDLVTLIAVANAVQNAITGGRGDLVVGLASASTMVLASWALSRFSRAHRFARRLVTGVPIVLVHHREVFSSRLRAQHVTREELDAALRAHGLSGPEQVELAVLEPDGTISVVPAAERQEGQ